MHGPLGQWERRGDVPCPGAPRPCAPDAGRDTRDEIPESWKPPAGTIHGGTHPLSFGIPSIRFHWRPRRREYGSSQGAKPLSPNRCLLISPMAGCG